jgi:phosphomevalonate kinase
MIRARAPGKALLAGEYAVLEGAPAIVVAVDRAVSAWWAPGAGSASSPFTVAALEAAARWLEARDLPSERLRQSGHLGVDSTALYDAGQKIGLGSSAAVTVAALAAALTSHGVQLVEDEPLYTPTRPTLTRAALFGLADDAHAEAQGTRGSGVDVATAIWGGALRYRRPAAPGQPPDVAPVALPPGLTLTFVFTGQSASTPQLIGRVRALQASAPDRARAALGRLVDETAAFGAALGDGAAATVEAAHRYGEALAALGRAADAPIVHRPLEELSQLARSVGGAAKPSGAGGGDLAVCFTASPDATRSLREALVARGLPPLSLLAPAPGLTVEESFT